MDVDIDTSRMANKSWPTSAECTLISIYRTLFRATTISGGMVNAQTISFVAAISHRRMFRYGADGAKRRHSVCK